MTLGILSTGMFKLNSICFPYFETLGKNKGIMFLWLIWLINHAIIMNKITLYPWYLFIHSVLALAEKPPCHTNSKLLPIITMVLVFLKGIYWLNSWHIVITMFKTFYLLTRADAGIWVFRTWYVSGYNEKWFKGHSLIWISSVEAQVFALEFQIFQWCSPSDLARAFYMWKS